MGDTKDSMIDNLDNKIKEAHKLLKCKQEECKHLQLRQDELEDEIIVITSLKIFQRQKTNL